MATGQRQHLSWVAWASTLARVLVLLNALGVAVCFAQQPAEAPFTCLFDTGAALPTPVAPQTLLTRTGWKLVAEDTLKHAFTGDIVLANDRLTVVLSPRSAAVTVYSRTPAGIKQRAVLMPLAGGQPPTAMAQITIVENSQAAVMLEVSLGNPQGPQANYRFRLSAGDALLDIRSPRAAGRLRIADQAQYVVVPDFFADDMVFDPANIGGSRIGLPSENSLLGLVDNGQAIITCIWPSSRQNADLLLSGEGAGRTIAGYEIDLPADGRLWLGVMEGSGIWHARRLTGPDASADVALDWKPPMPARWRADLAAADGTAWSSYFAGNDSQTAVQGDSPDGPCCFDAKGALLRPNKAPATLAAKLLAVYPMERTRTTPLTAFCLTDIMRSALGVGPCQYILDTEGLGAGESATPDQVARWIEKQFEKKASKRDLDAIGEQLQRMNQQVKRTDARLAEYGQFIEKIRQSCSQGESDIQSKTAAKRLMAILKNAATPSPDAAAKVQELAGAITANAQAEDALATCRPALATIRAAGAAQDYELAKLRMVARRLRQEARTLAVDVPQAAALASQVQQQVEQMLAKK